MPPRTEWAKSPVATYIYKHRKEQTRYEIDLTLLQAGHSPEEIEVAWQLVRHTSTNSLRAIKREPEFLILFCIFLSFIFSWAVFSPAPSIILISGICIVKLIIKRSANPTRTRPISIKIHVIDYLLLFGSLLLASFAWFSYDFWPFVNFGALINGLTALISLGIFIAIIFWGRKRKKAGFNTSFTLFLTNCLLGVICVATLCAFLIFRTASPSKEIANTSFLGENYHLLHSSSCFDFCNDEVVLYKCSFFNLICSKIDSWDEPYSWDISYLYPTSNSKKIDLKVEFETGKVLLLDGDNVLHTFKNV